MYKKSIYAVFVFVCISCLIVGCKDDKEKNAYKGVSKLIAERHRTRLAQSADQKENTGGKKYSTESIPESKDQSIPEETISEKKVKIISSDSGKTLARATAFINENGKIINIQIDQN